MKHHTYWPTLRAAEGIYAIVKLTLVFMKAERRISTAIYAKVAGEGQGFTNAFNRFHNILSQRHGPDPNSPPMISNFA